MIQKVAKVIFNDAMGNPLRRRALALAILLKEKNPTSVYKGWTFRDLAKAAGVSPNTIRKYLPVLREMHLARTFEANGYRYLELKKLRKRKIKNKHNVKFHTPKFSDVPIGKIGHGSLKDIEKGLMSLSLYEKARRTDYMRRLIELGTNPTRKDNPRIVKRARAICRKNGLEKFVEHGLPYSKIMRSLHCSPNTVKQIIGIGEGTLFNVIRREIVLIQYIGGGRAKEALSYFKCEYPNAFCTPNNIYYKPSLIFSPIK